MSNISRISTYANFQRTVNNFSSVSSSLSDTQEQISSGLKAKDFEGLNGFVEDLTNLTTTQKKQAQYIDNNTKMVGQITTQQQAVSSIIDLATQMQSLMVARRSANGQAASSGFSQQIDEMRNELSKQLNTQYGGKYLFSGTKTNIQPVITEPTPSTVTPGTPDTIYYQGGSQDMTIRPDDNLTISLSTRADDPAFQKIYSAISLALKADPSNNDSQLAAAYTQLHEGLSGVINIQTTLNDQITTLNDVTAQHQASNTYLKGITDDVTKTDQVKAATKLSVDSTTLQASFQAFSTIQNLNLSDYLK